MARNGKIARLPKGIREDLNAQLDDGVPGRDIVAWLNAQDEVKQVLAREFNGRPVSEQNLSQWRQGGFADWLRHQEALDRAAALAEQGREYLRTSKGVPLSDHLAPAMTLALVGRIESAVAAAAERADSGADPDPEAEHRLRGLSRELARLRRDDHRAARLRIEIEAARRLRQAHKEERKQKEEEENDCISRLLKAYNREMIADMIVSRCAALPHEQTARILREVDIILPPEPDEDKSPDTAPDPTESE